MRNRLTIILLLVCFSANAQVNNYEVVITGSRITDFYDMPTVTIIKNADFLVQEIRITNDSRSPELRKKEIIQTINNFVTSSKRIEGIELSCGEGFLTPVNLNDDSLELLEDHSRVDNNYVDISVKVSIDEKKAPKKQIARLRKFIQKTKKVGRTEIEIQGDIGLSIKTPEKYRYEILKKITEENAKTKTIIGGKCEISVLGLESRVQWARSGITELTLYIGYQTEIKCK